MTELKATRIRKKMTQREAATVCGVSLRSYISYENDLEKQSSYKYRYLLQTLEAVNPLDEEHGILSLAEIKAACETVFAEASVEFCYLFGSYAKGKASERSDVDLLIETKMTGLQFYGLTEKLRETLHKKVDLLTLQQVEKNPELLREILKEGVKIYG